MGEHKATITYNEYVGKTKRRGILYADKRFWFAKSKLLCVGKYVSMIYFDVNKKNRRKISKTQRKEVIYIYRANPPEVHLVVWVSSDFIEFPGKKLSENWNHSVDHQNISRKSGCRSGRRFRRLSFVDSATVGAKRRRLLMGCRRRNTREPTVWSPILFRDSLFDPKQNDSEIWNYQLCCSYNV